MTREQRDLRAVGTFYWVLGWLLAVVGGLGVLLRFGDWTAVGLGAVTGAVGAAALVSGMRLRRLKTSGWWGCLGLSFVLAPAIVPVPLLVTLLARRDHVGGAVVTG